MPSGIEADPASSWPDEESLTITFKAAESR